jgi:PD-(D/E)XK endonuclease
LSRRKGRTPRRNQRPAQALPTRTNHPSKTPFEREDATKRCGETTQLAFALKAARLRFGVSHPYGDSERYDVILDCRRDHLFQQAPNTAYLDDRARPRLIRIQVKGTTQLVDGLYRVNANRRINGRAVPYTLAEIDFFAAYVIPEDSWFIFPLTHILGATAVTLSPKRRRKPHINNPYREAWHLLREPDGLEFA